MANDPLQRRQFSRPGVTICEFRYNLGAPTGLHPPAVFCGIVNRTMIFNDNSLSIGRTPLVKLNRITDGAPVTLLAKIEGRNPAYSIKIELARRWSGTRSSAGY